MESLHLLHLLEFLIGLADARGVRYHSLVQALECAVKMFLICLCITVEVVIYFGFHLWWHIDSILIDITGSGLFLVILIGDGFEAGESLDWLLVDVHVLNLRWEDSVEVLLLGDLLLVHLHLLLVFLNAVVDAMG